MVFSNQMLFFLNKKEDKLRKGIHKSSKSCFMIYCRDTNSRKGRIHFQMLRTKDSTSILYFFDERVHCRTPRETFNAAKKKGLLIKAKNLSNYYQQ